VPCSVSVIIPTFNRAVLLPRALDSVLGQERAPDQIIVVDDGSTDNTFEVVKQYQSSGVQYFHQKNAGPGAARNLGIEHALGDFIAFLDSDDQWLPPLLARQLDMLNQHPSAGLCFCDTAWAKNNIVVEPSMNWRGCKRNFALALAISPGWTGCIPADRFRLAQLKCSLIPVSVVVARKELFVRCGKFRTDFLVAEDYEMWLRASRYFDFCYIDQPLGIIHVQDCNLTGRSDLRDHARRNMREILRGELSVQPDGPCREIILRRLFDQWEAEMSEWIQHGDSHRLKFALEQAKDDGWRPGPNTLRSIRLAHRISPRFAVWAQRLLNGFHH